MSDERPTDQEDEEDIDILESQIETAMNDRLPQLRAYLVRPYSIESSEGEVWVVAQRERVALYISIDADRFGVGFVDDGPTLIDADLYPTPEIAADAFVRTSRVSPSGH